MCSRQDYAFHSVTCFILFIKNLLIKFEFLFIYSVERATLPFTRYRIITKITKITKITNYKNSLGGTVIKSPYNQNCIDNALTVRLKEAILTRLMIVFGRVFQDRLNLLMVK